MGETSGKHEFNPQDMSKNDKDKKLEVAEVHDAYEEEADRRIPYSGEVTDVGSEKATPKVADIYVDALKQDQFEEALVMRMREKKISPKEAVHSLAHYIKTGGIDEAAQKAGIQASKRVGMATHNGPEERNDVSFDADFLRTIHGHGLDVALERMKEVEGKMRKERAKENIKNVLKEIIEVLKDVTKDDSEIIMTLKDYDKMMCNGSMTEIIEEVEKENKEKI